MSFSSFFGLINIGAALYIALLGGFVYFLGRTSATPKGFFLLCVTSTVWLGCYGAAYLELGNVDLWFRVGYIAVIFEAIAGYHFVVGFIRKKKEVIFVNLSYALALLFTLLHLFSDKIISGIRTYPWGFYPRAGALHAFLFCFIVVLVLRFIYLLYIYYNSIEESREKYEEKKKALYVLAGIGVFSLSAYDFMANYGLAVLPLGSVTFPSSVDVL